jgi:hypothetical protein
MSSDGIHPMLSARLCLSCPFIDFFNHQSSSTAECQYDWLRDSYQVVSDRPYRPGEQVLINYGAQSNDQLLQL